MSPLTEHPTATRPGSPAGAAVVAIGPVLLLAGLLWHPPIPGRLPDSGAVADAAADDITRWGLSHLAAALGAAALAVAFLVIRGYLRERGDGRTSAVGVGLVVAGSTLYAVLPGMEFAVLAAHETGADLAATQEALQPWFVPVLVGGSLIFAAGTSLFAVALVRCPPFGGLGTAVIAGALLMLGVSRLVPVGVVQLYVQAGAALLALLPLAAAIREPSPREHSVA